MAKNNIIEVRLFGLKVGKLGYDMDKRVSDFQYNTKGELISSYIVYKNMWKYTELEQY